MPILHMMSVAVSVLAFVAGLALWPSLAGAQSSCSKTLGGASTKCIDLESDELDFPLNVFAAKFRTGRHEAYHYQANGSTFTIRRPVGTIDGDRASISLQETVHQWSTDGNYKELITGEIRATFRSATDLEKMERLKIKGGFGRAISFKEHGKTCTVAMGIVLNKKSAFRTATCGKATAPLLAVVAEARRSSRGENSISQAQAARAWETRPARQAQPAKANLRAFSADWEGFDTPVTGYLEIGRDNARTLSLTLPKGLGDCTGRFTPEEDGRGLWYLRCDNGTTASGAYTGRGTGQGSSGEGFDNEGRIVKFDISGS